MKSPFRQRKHAPSTSEEHKESTFSSQGPIEPNRGRSDTGSSWPGTLRREAPPAASKPLSYSRIVTEELPRLSLYLLGSSTLHLLFQWAQQGTMEDLVAAARLSSQVTLQVDTTVSSFELFLQAAWLYYMSETVSSRTDVDHHCQPILSARLASWRLGRLQLREILVTALLHIFVMIVHIILLSEWLDIAVKDTTVISFLQASLQMIFCVVILMVGPTILHINRLPPSFVILLLRPPCFVVPMSALNITELLAAQILSGVVAGRILQQYFPDDPKY